MKTEIGKDFPQYSKSSYPEEFELFSHFETTAGIQAPQNLVTGEPGQSAIAAVNIERLD